jgi:hypothetical protein
LVQAVDRAQVKQPVRGGHQGVGEALDGDPVDHAGVWVAREAGTEPLMHLARDPGSLL